MSVTFKTDTKEAQQLQEYISQYKEEAERKINSYLHGQGYELFEKSIHNAMPVSGRKWSGKKPPAKTAKSIQEKTKDENLAVTLRATTTYNYLYFPDDGSNTEKHNGNQHFFEKGVEDKTAQATKDMMELLIKED